MTSGLYCVNFIFTYEFWCSNTMRARTNTLKHTSERVCFCVCYIKIGPEFTCHYYVLTRGCFIHTSCGVVHCYTAHGLLIQIRSHLWSRLWTSNDKRQSLICFTDRNKPEKFGDVLNVMVMCTKHTPVKLCLHNILEVKIWYFILVGNLETKK